MYYKRGNVYKGIVTAITDYGAFISLDDDCSGLIHISEMSDKFVQNITDYVNIDDEIYVKVLDTYEDNNHLKLSIKNIDYKEINKKRRKKIKETPLGFKTLSYYLPIWIEKNYQNLKKR